MKETIKSDFIKQTKAEIQHRIEETDEICKKLKDCSRYSLKIFWIFFAIVFGLLLIAIAFVLINAEMILGILYTQDYSRDSMLLKMSLIGVCVYLVLRIHNGIMNILMLSKIDDHITNVKNIRINLDELLKNINGIADEAEKQNFSKTNEKSIVLNNIDADIEKHSNILETYSGLKNKSIGLPVFILHWITGVLFAVIFVIISTPFAVGLICELLDNYNFDFFAPIYILIFLIIFIILLNIYPFNPGTIKKKQINKKRELNNNRYFIDPQTYLRKSNKKNLPAKKRNRKGLLCFVSAFILLVGFGVHDNWYPGIISSAEKLIQKGQEFFKEQDFENANRQFNDSIRFNPMYAAGYAWRGETFRMMEQYEEAINDFTKAIEIDSDFAWVFARRGEAYLLKAEYEMAASDFYTAFGIDHNTFEYDYEKAFIHFNEAIRLDRDFVQGYIWRAHTNRMRNRFDAAMNDLNQAIRLDPENVFAFALRGDTHRMRNQLDAGIRELNNAIRIDEDYALAYGLRGRVQKQRRQVNLAIEDFEKALELNPKLEWVRQELQELLDN